MASPDSTDRTGDSERGLPQLVAAQAVRTPDAVAATWGHGALTYGDLDRRANRLARRLVALGVGPDVPVALALTRSPDLPVAVLAVLKAGGAYVPVDPNYPPERVAFLLSDCRASVLLTQSTITDRLPAHGLTTLRLDADPFTESDELVDVAASLDDLGYVIYTSGSTGTPKGVAMRRGALSNLIRWQLRSSSAGPGDVTLQFASLSFDVSFQEILSTLASGGTLALIPEDLRHDPPALLAFLRERRVSRLFVPPVVLYQLAEAAVASDALPDSLREVIVAGEQLRITPATAALFARLPGCTLHNHYGPSETHVATAHTLTGPPAGWPTLPPIGRPIDGVRAYIVDGSLQSVPDGETGELLLGGECLARGYWHRPELTEERFLSDPFAVEPGTRVYRTGDLVRRRADGVLEFLGRADEQIKIRGFRVEPGEVEAALSQHPAVRAAAVTGREDESGQRRLVGYVVPHADAPPADDLRRFLAERLPEHMVPEAFVSLERLPLTPSGKVDRRALPAPECRRPELPTPFVAPRTPTEEVIARVWCEVLGLDRVGIDDEFRSLGGHSLAAARILTRLQVELGRPVPVALLFRHPTIRALAAALVGSAVRTNAASNGPHSGHPTDPIAVVGLAGRFPGAADVEQFWRNLCDGVESVTVFSDEELRDAGVDADDLSDPDYVKARALVSDADRFDAAFFGYPPREAEQIDPQHRLFLETAWAALEHAGYDPLRAPGPVGVFAGSSVTSYLLANVCSDRAAVELLVRTYQAGGFPALFGNDKDYLATRVAYKLDLRGPAVTVQTACSTALVAVAQACDALRADRCTTALAGGVSVTVPRVRGYRYQEGAMVSPDGHCRAFDADARGTVFGEGVGVVVLKRLSDAQADGDTIYAVIRGVGVTNDGAEKVSFAAPSAAGQAAAIRQALAQAGVEAGSISYVEAHGTGTPLGDPIEVEGLTEAFRADTDAVGFCALGSVKTNFGHLEAAAGAAGLIKTVLALHHRRLPPTLHYLAPNPRIDFAHSPFRVQDRLADWPAGSAPRRAGVSSMGVGGTNAHVVLEEALPAPSPDTGRSQQLLVLSAKTATALDAATSNLRDYLRDHPDLDLADVAYTLQVGRHAFPHRRAVVVRDGAEDWPAAVTGTAPADAPPVAFLFPGQGAQRVGMGRELYAAEPIFRAELDRCAELLRPHLGFDLRDVLYPPAGEEKAAEERLRQTAVTQPALFAVAYALAKLWQHWGVEPRAMFGHSIGEYVAACLAGVFTLEDALAVVATRGRLVQELPGGAMLAVRLPEAELRPLLGPGLDLAAVNGSAQCVVSGSSDAIAAFGSGLTERKIGYRLLTTSHAFHSAMLDPVLDRFAEAVAGVKRERPALPFLSCVTGTWITPEQAVDPGYWAEHLRGTVRCADALHTLVVSGHLLLEVGPGRTLCNLAAAPVGRAIASLPESSPDESETAALLSALGRVWVAGVAVDWPRFHAPIHRRRVSLPTYPFERQRYWIEAPAALPSPGFAGEGPGVRGLLPMPAEAPSPPAPLPQSRERGEEGHLPALQALFAHLTGIPAERLDPGASFFALGLDSLALTQVTLAVQNRFGVKVSFRQLLEDLPTLGVLAEYLDRCGAPTAAPSPKPATPARPAPAELPQGFGAFQPIDRSADAGWTPRQRHFVTDLIARYTGKTAKSKEHVQEYRAVHADPRTVAGFNRLWKEMVYPIVVDRSAGSRLWDVDGNEYIDLLNGFGPDLFGHSPPFVVEAVTEQLRKGYEVGPLSPLAGQVAKLICELTGMDRASFVCTGSEAVQAALRAARTATGRDRVVLFARDYHGNFDEVLVRPTPGPAGPSAPGIPADAVGNVLVLDYGTPAALDAIREHGPELAAVLVEPVQSRRPELQPRDFLHEVRRLTEQSGTALIFDEVITGFRLHPGGAQAFYGVRADITTYGKVVGGGMPFGVVAGRSAFMDVFDGGTWQYGDDSAPEAGRTFFAGTFTRHPLALAAAVASLTRLKEVGPALQEGLAAKAKWLVSELNAICERNNVPLKVVHCGSVLFFRVLDNSKPAVLLFYLLREKGVYLLEGFPSYLSTAHTDEDLRRVARAFREGVEELRDAGFFDAPDATPSLPAPSVNGAAHLPEPSGGETVTLTEAQRELWLAAQADPAASCAFNESCTLELHGPLDLAALRGAIQDLIARHEALRTTFDPAGEFQTIAPSLELDVPLVEVATEQELTSLLDAEDRQPFDLAHGPLLRARVARLAADDHRLILTVHHIACDGWSYDVLLRELAALYSARAQGRPADLPEPGRFSAFARQQVEGDRSAVAAYWRRQFADPPPPLDLPADRPRPAQRTYRGDRRTQPLGPELAAAVRQAAAKLDCTAYTALFAAFQALLHRLTGQDDLAVGIPTAGQAQAGEPALVGHCVNFLPIRGHVEASRPARDLLHAVRQRLLDAFEHPVFTYVSLLRVLDLPRDPGRPPLVSVSFNVDPRLSELSFAGLRCEVVKNPRHFVNFELHWNLVETADDYLIECEYNAGLFDAGTVERWIGHYRTLLAGLVADPDEAVARLPLLTPAERQQILIAWNNTDRLQPVNDVPGLFEEQARRRPDAVALASDSGTVTYADLNRRANRLARYLRRQGVGPETPVAVGLGRSPELVVALLGILKASGAYLPLDPSYPAQRIAFIARDAGARLLVTDSAHADAFAAPGLLPLLLDADADRIAQEDDTDLGSPADPERLAYVMYTSGSTGEPKGTLIPHPAIVRLLFGQDYVRFGPERTFAALAPVAFDASTFEIWGPLLHGGRLALAPDGATTPAELGEFLRRHRVDTLWLTTGLFNTVIDTDLTVLAGVQQLLTGGEALSVPHVRRALAALPNTEVINGYGPTETTTFACTYSVPRDLPADAASVPIGQPIGNTRCYVLDRAGQPVPVGVVGELHIGGPGLARGYLNRPELTASRFIPDTVTRTVPASHSALYRTGDRVRWRPDGVLEFVGRTDNQVKVRGFRIEPGEIEAVLAAHPDVAAAAVVVRREPTGARLVAYAAPRPGRVLAVEGLLGYLRERLPAYMVPSAVVPLDALRLTANGKVDRAALPAPEAARPADERPYVAPRFDAERDLAALFAEVLHRPRVGITDDFFELGGHSLLAAELIAKVRSRLGHTLPLSTLYSAPTVETLAARIQQQLEAGCERSIVPLHRAGARPPLFLIAGVGGHVFTFQKFARLLGPDQPTYGVKAIGVDGTRATPEHFEEVAAEYVRELTALRPHGPYLLGGYSVGAVVALEVALQLQKRGERVPLLLVFDAYAPGYPPHRSLPKRALMHLGHLLSGRGRGRRAYLRQRVASLKEKLNWWLGRGHLNAPPVPGMDMMPQDSLRHVWLALNKGYACYRPQGRLEGATVVVRSEEMDDWEQMVTDDPLLGWAHWVNGPIEAHSLPGGHLELFRERNIEPLAGLVRECIGRLALAPG